jgi:hypothetical protein
MDRASTRLLAVDSAFGSSLGLLESFRSLDVDGAEVWQLADRGLAV